MKRVSKQQFIRYTSKYLKDMPVIVTHRGIDNLIIKDVDDETCRGSDRQRVSDSVPPAS